MKLAGLDIGTTGCKCTVFDEKGNILTKAYRTYPVKRAISGHEVDAFAIKDGVFAVLSEVASKYSDIAGIGVTSFGETFVMTDSFGNPLHNSMLYTDPRGAEQCKKLIDKFGEKEIAKRTGLRPHEMYGLPKMMWIKENLPDVYSKVEYIFEIEDFVVFLLTGVRQIDYSLATRTLGFNINTLTWDKEIFECAGIDVNKMAKVVPTGTDAGAITKEVAKATGLSTNTHIVSVSHDQVSAAVGAGIFDSSVAVDGAGTVECVTPLFDGVPNVDVMYNGYYSIVPYVIPNKYVAYAFSYTGGALIQWCTETLAKEEARLAKDAGISVNEYLEKEYAIKHKDDNSPIDLLVLPHFAGAATPYMDTGSKGVVIGMTIDTTVSDIYYACLQGVAFEMLLNMKYLEGSGICYKKLNATGGGAHSKVWMQMKADVLNMPITALKTVDAGTVGSAMLTGIAVGAYKDLKEAASIMVEETTTYYPREDMHKKYLKLFERYEKIYNLVRPIM